MGFIFDKFGEIPNIPSALQSDPDFKSGLEVLKAFHSKASEFSSYKLSSVEDLIAFYGIKGPYMVEGIGLNIRVNDIPISTAKNIVSKLADKGKGKVPENWMSYTNALKNYAMNPSIIDALKFTATESWKELEAPLTDLKEGAFSTLKISKYALPVLVWGGLGFLAYTWITKSTVLFDVAKKGVTR